MDWQVTKTRVLRKVAAGASAAGDLGARYAPRLIRPRGVVSAFFDGTSVGIAVIRPQNRHSRVETSATVTLDVEAFANPAAAGKALAKAVAGLKRPPRALVAVVGAELTFERRIALPPMPVEETDVAVEFQADRVLPFPAGEMRVDYAIESAGADGVQSVIVLAITDETARGIEAVAQAAGLTLAATFSAPWALYASVAADEAAGGRPKAVIYRRREGIEIAVGTTRAVAMSRFARNGDPGGVPGELARTASAAGIALDKGALVFAPREFAGALASAGSPFEASALDAALEARAGASGDSPAAAVAIAAGTLYVRGVPVPNFHAPSASERRKRRVTAYHGRIAKYGAAACAVVALFSVTLVVYWVYTLVLESKARGLAAANAALKAAVARSDTARTWLTARTILLDVLGGVTDVFPESAGAFVKSLSVAESGKVSVQGKVPNPKAAYDLVAALSNVKGFRNVKLDTGTPDPAGGYAFGISFDVDSWRAKK